MSNELHAAIVSGDLDAVDRLLAAGADPNAMHDDATALMAAVDSEKPELVERLLRAGARPDDLSYGGRTALSVPAAFAWGRDADAALEATALRMIEVLIAGGADPNAGDDWQWYPITAAAQAGSKAVFERLLDAGAKVRDDTLSELLNCNRDDRLESLVLLATRCPEVSPDRALLALARQPFGPGVDTAVRALVALGASPDAIDEETGATPLLYAVFHSAAELARELVAAGARLDFVPQAKVVLEGMPLRKNPSPRSYLAERYRDYPDGMKEMVDALGVDAAGLVPDTSSFSVVGTWAAATSLYESSPDDDPEYFPEPVEADPDELGIELREDGTCSLRRWSDEEEGRYELNETTLRLFVEGDTYELAVDAASQTLSWSDHDEEHGSDYVITLERA